MKKAILGLAVATAFAAAASTGTADETLKQAGPPPSGAQKAMPRAGTDEAKTAEAAAPLDAAMLAARSARQQEVGDAQAGVVTDSKATKH
jgi:hypothetical protein